MNYHERPTRYFSFCGEVNTDFVLKCVRSRSDETGIGKVVLASETGRSAVRALDLFKDIKLQLIVVTHYPSSTWGPKGKIPIGLNRPEYKHHRQQLIDSGVQIVQSTRPFAPPSRSIDWNHPTPEAIVDKTLEVFGAGTKIAIESVLMATDSNALSVGEDVITCAGTYKGLDTALIVKATHSSSFFESFVVREIIAKPSCRVEKLPEHEYENWKGDLDQYYPDDS